MAKRQIFYSFHYDNDVFRVQQIRNIGSLEDNKPVSLNEWEQLKRSGDTAVKNWIDENIRYKNCLVVLIGSETANRKWVKYEIEKAWNDGRAVLGIYIHNLKCPKGGTCRQGSNPFEQITIKDGRKLSSIVSCYNPTSYDTYNNIKNNLEYWIEDAISRR
jgi:hypothetical protein